MNENLDKMITIFSIFPSRVEQKRKKEEKLLLGGGEDEKEDDWMKMYRISGIAAYFLFTGRSKRL